MVGKTVEKALNSQNNKKYKKPLTPLQYVKHAFVLRPEFRDDQKTSLKDILVHAKTTS